MRLGRLVVCLASLCGVGEIGDRVVQAEAVSVRPHIVVVLADDLGYGDIGCYGHPTIQTPHLDRLAQQGLKLTHCYAAHPNCSPSRTGLMTGRTPYRVGVHNWIPMHSPMHVGRREITIATLLRDAGYDTCHVGKWHLNGGLSRNDQPQPIEHGFNHSFATQNNALPNHKDPFNFVRNGEEVGPLQGYAGPLVAEEASRWLKTGRDPQKPFFLFVCLHEPHEPINTDAQYRKLYPGTSKSHSRHHGNITQMDAAFGIIDQTLSDIGASKSTLLLFTSDNGPAITGKHPHGSSGGLREKKGHAYEGGIRVPGLIRWPGHTQPGTVSSEPISGVDLLPTLCEVAGVKPPADRALDGCSWLPVLEQKPLVRKRPLYWHFLRASSDPKVALRDGPWKLLATLDMPELPRGADITEEENAAIKTAQPQHFELYNLFDDPHETQELSAERPAQFKRLKKELLEYYAEVQAESPVWPVWEWPRYEGGLIVWPTD